METTSSGIEKYSEIPVVILCGGRGTRMREETDIRPKPLITIGGTPILLHIMNLYYYYGFNKFVLPLGYKGNMIKDFFLDYRYSNAFRLKIEKKPRTSRKKGVYNIEILDNSGLNEFEITFVETGLETLTGSRVKAVSQYLNNKFDIFMLTYGDCVSDINILELLSFHNSHGKLVTVTGTNSPSKYGEIFHEGGKVVSYNHKTEAQPFLINGGFYVCNMKFLDYIENGSSCGLEGIPLFRATTDEQFMVYKHKGKWASVDTLNEVDELNRMYENGDRFWIKS